MTIYKSNDFVEVYRAKSQSKDINELTGRTGRPDLTEFVIDNIVAKFTFKEDDIVVDIGCGDGLFLRKVSCAGVNARVGRLIGVLPTIEEVLRIQRHLIEKNTFQSSGISIELGLLDNLGNIPDEYANKTISNSTIHILQEESVVDKAILEMKRITKSNGLIFFGEVPDTNELKDKRYGDSITSWLFWVLKNQGFPSFLIRLKQVLIGFFTKEPFVIAPKIIFHATPEVFVKKLKSHGLIVKSFYKHKEIGLDGNELDSMTRWNYIAVKK
jgi:ubiquinone/menaquinone biosynthesis C-methylase UbiE